MEEVVVHSVKNRVGVIELARPEKFNCLSTATIRGIDEARVLFEADSEVRAILIRSRGKYFCTGADLEEVTQAQSESELDQFIGFGQQVL